ncbi:superoxide dismutase [Candidatus Woesearchaeota archaeon]|nr:superoxide dismutase [Candidatus Woesearchaeota archaeon]
MQKHELPKLSYSYDALEPFIDTKTMEIHHTKHHQTYVDKLNVALEKHSELFDKDLKELIKNINLVPEDIRTAVKNHGGGHLNHSLYWQIMTSDKKERKFEGKIADEIKKIFGSYDEFKKKLTEVALGVFGSGWAWLVVSNGKLEIISTPNQDSPLIQNKIPILGIDVWEHAYYILRQNRRNDYVEAFFNVINWKKVNENFKII